MDNKVLRMIGLANRAGKVITGTELCEKAVKSGKAKLVILAKEASASTVKTFENFGIDIVFVESRELLGKYTGKEIRTVAVICDEGFARVIKKESEES